MAAAFNIIPVRQEDVPLLAALSAEAFESDSQTEMKSHGKVPFNMREHALRSLPRELQNPIIRIIKAADDESGAIMGYCIWGFRGIQPPAFPADVTPPPPEPTAPDRPRGAHVNPPPAPIDAESDGVARLEKLTGDDLQNWMDLVMPPPKDDAGNSSSDTKCMFVIGLSVSPAFQRRGVGAALLKWGTDLVDASDAFAWVHSSAGAWPAYEKAGFKTVRTLDVDLDEYAPVPAPADRFEGGRWGHYVFRYMVYGTPPEGAYL
ncbi:hypothetical protein B0T24DRAFT_632354 [Lasiosphaeria ovina]|uniref:N-acetyltransferase domain-containing protein n=1 Tax=Lasiosphaeria ovina TaxID=92902 RepID=A0AAE0K3H2_9PEZI|nr:hypothetical protein B0T24DRAFT_632354 [Lasiosphaeria ovina]